MSISNAPCVAHSKDINNTNKLKEDTLFPTHILAHLDTSIYHTITIYLLYLLMTVPSQTLSSTIQYSLKKILKPYTPLKFILYNIRIMAYPIDITKSSQRILLQPLIKFFNLVYTAKAQHTIIAWPLCSSLQSQKLPFIILL